MFSSVEEIKPGDVNLVDGRTAERPPEPVDNHLPYRAAKEKKLKEFNQSFIGHLLEENNGNVSQAARQCGLERQALQQIMRRYEIKADRYRK